MTWQQWLNQAVDRLRLSLSLSAKLDAEILLSRIIGVTRAQLLAFGETNLTELQYIILEELLICREHSVPIAYLIGEKEFWSLKLKVSLDTFIPRPDTECLVQSALTLLPANYKEILDLGTGSGAIALALASERPDWKITGVDYSLGAISIARDNAASLGLTNVQFYKSNWFQALQKKRYALIVSNPPYIKENDHHLTQGEICFEPRYALVAGSDGLKYLRMICKKARKYLLPRGWLLIEHGWNQGVAVRSMLTEAGFCRITTIRDYGGNARVSQGQLFS